MNLLDTIKVMQENNFQNSVGQPDENDDNGVSFLSLDIPKENSVYDWRNGEMGRLINHNEKIK